MAGKGKSNSRCPTDAKRGFADNSPRPLAPSFQPFPHRGTQEKQKFRRKGVADIPAFDAKISLDASKPWLSPAGNNWPIPSESRQLQSNMDGWAIFARLISDSEAVSPGDVMAKGELMG